MAHQAIRELSEAIAKTGPLWWVAIDDEGVGIRALKMAPEVLVAAGIPIAAKGDLLSHDGSNLAAMPAGAAGSVLVSSPGQTSGLEYVDQLSLTALLVAGADVGAHVVDATIHFTQDEIRTFSQDTDGFIPAPSADDISQKRVILATGVWGERSVGYSSWVYDGVAAGAPSASKWRANNALPGSITEIRMNTVTGGKDAKSLLESAGNGDHLTIQTTDESVWALYKITSVSVVGSDATIVVVVQDTEGPAFSIGQSTGFGLYFSGTAASAGITLIKDSGDGTGLVESGDAPTAEIRSLKSPLGSVSFNVVDGAVELEATGIGGGEANRGTNLGVGLGVYDSFSGANLQFNSFDLTWFEFSQTNTIGIKAGVFDSAGSAGAVQTNLDTHTATTSIHFTQDQIRQFSVGVDGFPVGPTQPDIDAGRVLTAANTWTDAYSSVLVAKGDLLTNNGADDVPLSVGLANTHALFVDSTAPTGMNWRQSTTQDIGHVASQALLGRINAGNGAGEELLPALWPDLPAPGAGVRVMAVDAAGGLSSIDVSNLPTGTGIQDAWTVISDGVTNTAASGEDTITFADSANLTAQVSGKSVLFHLDPTTINHVDLQNVGTNTHSEIDVHIATGSIHFADATADGKLYSRFNSAWAEAAAAVHTHATTDVVGFVQDRIGGRITASTGAMEQLTAAQVLTMIGVEAGANNYVHPDHTGDVTSTGDGAQVIAIAAVTYAKIQATSAASVLLGRGDDAPGSVQEITLGPNLTMTGTVLDGAPGGASSPLTTKGDLFGFDIADARIPIGLDDQVLTADSSQGLGVKWVTPSSGGGHTIQDEGTPLTQRVNLNFVGAGVTVTDDDPDTTVTIPGGVGGGISDAVAQFPAIALQGYDGGSAVMPVYVPRFEGNTIHHGIALDSGTDQWVLFEVEVPPDYDNSRDLEIAITSYGNGATGTVALTTHYAVYKPGAASPTSYVTSNTATPNHPTAYQDVRTVISVPVQTAAVAGDRLQLLVGRDTTAGDTLAAQAVIVHVQVVIPRA